MPRKTIRKRKLKDLPKAAWYEKHARYRIGVRTDAEITKEQYNLLCLNIQEGRSTLFQKKSNNISIHYSYINGKPYVVVYDKGTKKVKTVLFIKNKYKKFWDKINPIHKDNLRAWDPVRISSMKYKRDDLGIFKPQLVKEA